MLFSLPLLLLLRSTGSGPRFTAITCGKPPRKTGEGTSRMGGKTSPVKSFETETRTMGAFLTLLLITVLIGPGTTSHNPHQPAKLTWVINNPETGEVLNSSSNVAPKGTWWPVLTFGPCILHHLVSFIRECLNTIQIMELRQQYQPISQGKEKDSSTKVQRHGGNVRLSRLTP